MAVKQSSRCSAGLRSARCEAPGFSGFEGRGTQHAIGNRQAECATGNRGARRVHRRILLEMALLLTAMLPGCGIAPTETRIADVDTKAWIAPAEIEYRNRDTTTARRLEIVVRSNENIRYDTLTLRIALLSPDTVRYQEPFMIRIPQRPKAAPLRRETTTPYRTQVLLADTGAYRFTITPTRPVQGIEAVGIHIANDR